WLIVEHGGDLGEPLAARIRRHGGSASVAGAFQPTSTGGDHGVVYLCDAGEEAQAPAEAAAATIGRLHLVQAVSRAGGAAAAAVGWGVLARGSQAVTGDETGHVAQAPLWGLARTVRFEHPELQTVCIDLAPDAPDLDLLVAEVLAPDEAEVAHRNGTRYVARL